MAESNEQVIMGIDPGTVVMGYSVITCKGQKISIETMGTLKMSWTHDVFERLHKIYQTIDEVIRTYRPNEFAIEAPFYGKNVQSMLKLGRAQGVAIACALQHGLAVTEYSPKKVKQAITGNGNAAKEQVWNMLQKLTGIAEKPGGYDASDALGVAVCHYYQAMSPLGQLAKGKASGWEAFIRNNPNRVAKK
ncbi:MAG: crossover junction endodeoxyribonuclease RuvC [Chitinophagaceae bacterium]|jgi:crossover junction endodeoxyribonuclease RuvC|nr:crossover junction endodeoxyribonuclease RuvC [Chitinophagaceae bacterium]MCU0404082.1 crossover junction endodeoxyribonuclease RuvC [Chitinophagaceae bacterium]